METLTTARSQAHSAVSLHSGGDSFVRLLIFFIIRLGENAIL